MAGSSGFALLRNRKIACRRYLLSSASMEPISSALKRFCFDQPLPAVGSDSTGPSLTFDYRSRGLGRSRSRRRRPAPVEAQLDSLQPRVVTPPPALNGEVRTQDRPLLSTVLCSKVRSPDASILRQDCRAGPGCQGPRGSGEDLAGAECSAALAFRARRPAALNSRASPLHIFSPVPARRHL